MVGNVAALTDHKDHATLLEAAALRRASACPRRRFVIVGEGELRARARGAGAARLGLEGHVVFAGFRPDLDRLLPAFDVFCLSSHMEGLGTSLLDAMAFGRADGGHRGGRHPRGGRGRRDRAASCPPRDAAALAAALFALLADAAPGARPWARAGAQRFLARFTAERMVEETLGVYAEAA